MDTYTLTVSRNAQAKSTHFPQPPTAREVAWLMCAFASIPYEELEEAFLRTDGLIEGVNTAALQGFPLGYAGEVFGITFTIAKLVD